MGKDTMQAMDMSYKGNTFPCLCSAMELLGCVTEKCVFDKESIKFNMKSHSFRSECQF